MATPNLKLIAALRAAADGVESGRDDYAWTNAETCNCGIVAQKLTGFDKLRLRDELEPLVFDNLFYGHWCSTPTCVVTGKRTSQIFSAIRDAGMSMDDIDNLENLSDPEVLRNMRVSHLTKWNPEHFILYVRAWADMLEEQLPPIKQDRLPAKVSQTALCELVGTN